MVCKGRSPRWRSSALALGLREARFPSVSPRTTPPPSRLDTCGASGSIVWSCRCLVDIPSYRNQPSLQRGSQASRAYDVWRSLARRVAHEDGGSRADCVAETRHRTIVGAAFREGGTPRRDSLERKAINLKISILGRLTDFIHVSIQMAHRNTYPPRIV